MKTHKERSVQKRLLDEDNWGHMTSRKTSSPKKVNKAASDWSKDLKLEKMNSYDDS